MNALIFQSDYAILAIYFKLDYFVTTLLYFGLPGLYLSLQDRKKIKRNLIFSILFTVPAVYVDYLAEKSLAWFEPSSIFHFRIGGIVPIEAILWFFLLSYLVIAFYEHFFDHATHKSVGKHMKILLSLAVVGTTFFIVQLLMHKQPVISYFYLKFGVNPPRRLFIKVPKISFCFYKIGAVFFGAQCY